MVRAARRPGGRDDQRAVRRRRGLVPGVGVRGAHRTLRLGRLSVPGRAQRRPRARTAGEAPRACHVLHARLDRAPLPGSRASHRRRRSRSREPRLCASSRNGPGAARVLPGHRAREASARGHRRSRRSTAIARRASRSPAATCGPSTPSRAPAIGTARACTRCTTITTGCRTHRASCIACRTD